MALRIIDYGSGNPRSVYNALWRLGEEAAVSADPDDIATADRLILPGVGAAAWALENMRRTGLADAMHEAVIERGRPFLGICAGMQVLAERLTEFGDHQGLGWVPGEVRVLNAARGSGENVPHIGWSALDAVRKPKGFATDARRSFYYFCHSYALFDTDPAIETARCARYGGFTAALCRDSIMAVQFHPEKSQLAGEEFIEAFLDWTP